MLRRNFLNLAASAAALAGFKFTPAVKPDHNVVLGPGCPRNAKAGDPGAELLTVYRNFDPAASLHDIAGSSRVEMVAAYNADEGWLECYAYEAVSVARPIPRQIHSSGNIFGYARRCRNFIWDPVRMDWKTYRIQGNWAVIRKLPDPAWESVNWEKMIELYGKLGFDKHNAL